MIDSEPTKPQLDELPNRADSQMQHIIDSLEGYVEPQNSCLYQLTTESQTKLGPTGKPPNIPRTMPQSKVEKETDTSRTLHNQVSNRRNIIDCNNLNGTGKLRHSQNVFDVQMQENPTSPSHRSYDISQSLEATRLLHGGKPLPAMTHAQTIEITDEAVKEKKRVKEPKAKKSLQAVVQPNSAQLLSAYFPSLVKKKSAVDDEFSLIIHGQLSKERKNSKKSKSTVNKTSAKENNSSNIASDGIVLLHEHYPKNVLTQKPEASFVFGTKTNGDGFSQEARHTQLGVRRNSLTGSQKLPPIVSCATQDKKMKIGAQAAVSPTWTGSHQQEKSGKTDKRSLKKLDNPNSQPQQIRKNVTDLTEIDVSHGEFDQENDLEVEAVRQAGLVRKALQQQKSEIQNQSYRNMELNRPDPIKACDHPSNLLNMNDSEGENQDQSPAIGHTSELKNEKRTDYESKNLERLKEMAERRKQEALLIEESRNKMKRKQEKLKEQILKEAAEYKALKAQRMAEIQVEQEILLKNQNDKGKPFKKVDPTQPKLQKRISQNSPQYRDSQPLDEEQKQTEEQQEEKRKFEMMRKYYRNRHHTFLAALVEQKKKQEEDQKAFMEAEAKKIAKAREKILGDPTKIKAKYHEVIKQEQAIEQLNDNQSGQIYQGSGKPIKRKTNNIDHDTSLTNLNGTFSVYTDPYSRSKSSKHKVILGIRVSSQQRKRGKRSKSRDQELQAKSATNFMERNRTLTPQGNRGDRKKQMPESGLHQELVVDAKTQMLFDENREQEILKEAAERKARNEQIKLRQQKQLEQIKIKKEAELKKIEDEKQRQEKILKIARDAVLAQFEAQKNAPTLREQQDSRAMAKRKQDDENHSPKKVPVEMAPVAIKAIQNFLERNKTMNQVFLNITDMKEWKKKNRVDDQTKVFICTGGYGDVKRALKKRGWVENKDKDSVCFDLKWTLKTKDIDVNKLEDHQIVNHFAKATSITTKVGLTHSLKNLIWFNNVDIDTFYPRCFDLGIEEEMQDFIQEFKSVKAQCVLKTYVREMLEAYEQDKDLSKKLVAPSVDNKLLKVAIKVCSKRTRDLDELIDDPNGFENLVSDAEWKILAADEMTEEDLMAKKHNDWIKKNDIKHNKPKRPKRSAKPSSKRKPEEKKDGEEENSDEYAEDYGEVEEAEDEEKKMTDAAIAKLSETYPLFKQANDLLKVLKEKYPQFGIDGERNIWICKPAGSSRGRGIVLYRQLVQILDLCKQKETQYIVQKYIENTLIVKNRKFDIRQWVLVTSWNPLIVWLYAEPYIRFPASDFSFDSINNRYAHLSNNSIAKHAKTKENMYYIEGNMWQLSDFQDWLQEEYGSDVWDEVLVDKIKSIVINSLESVQDMFESSNKGQMFELFGYDIMVDDDLNCWLIEVNSSPAMDYSTPVTERLVKLVLEDTIKVVVDYAQASHKKKHKVDTGLYECIYRATRIVDKPLNSFGLNLEVQGKAIQPKNLSKW